MKKENKQYNIGDRFIVTISEKYAPETESPRGDSPEPLYRMNGFKSLVFDEEGLRKLKPYNPHKEVDIEAIRDDAYYNGAREAWELAALICGGVDRGGFPVAVLKEIFHSYYSSDIIFDYPFSEAKDKVEAWRAKKAQKSERESFKPGDIVMHKSTGELAIVATFPEHGGMTVVTRNGLLNVATAEYDKVNELRI